MSADATEQAKAVDARCERAGLYVHVPFCASTCDFCAFYQTMPTPGAVERFLGAIQHESEMLRWPGRVETIFWGGGTPGLLMPAQMEKLAAVFRPHLKEPPTEWTVELAPASVTVERLRMLRELGVTRVSLGVQSFRDDLLEALGRQHSTDQIYRAYERVRAANFHSVNIDMMFALPGQSAENWREDLATAIRLQPDHISTYCLTFEEDTALWLKLSQGKMKLDPLREAALYESTWDQLGEAGYSQYEISNFARPGHECRHNLATWHMGSWIGLGPSAASQYDGWRGTNISDLDQWEKNLANGERATEDRLEITPPQLAADAIIFGLRLNEGVDLNEWKKSAPEFSWGEAQAVFDHLSADGLLAQNGSRVRLTRRGRLLADAVAAEILGATESSTAPA